MNRYLIRREFIVETAESLDTLRRAFAYSAPVEMHVTQEMEIANGQVIAFTVIEDHQTVIEPR